MPNENKKAIIIGCGIAGPVLALALNKAGIDSEIYEAQKALDDDAGLFHYLSPNGMNVFNVLGIYDKVYDLGHVCNRTTLYDENGNSFAGFDEENLKDEFGASSIMIKRGVLTKVLREEVISKGIDLHFGKKLKDIENVTGESKVTVHFEDDTSVQGDFLIGCDGIHSRTRKIIMPDAPDSSYTKLVVAGGYAKVPIKSKKHSMIHANYCKRAYLAYFILPDGEVWWWNAELYPQEQTREKLEKISNKQWRQSMIKLYKEDSQIIQDIVGSPENRFMKYPISDMPPLDIWYKGNVCLIGDAVHATSPTNGQGAAMASEDGIVLAMCLRDMEIPKDAFEKFQELRKERVEKIVKFGRRNGEGYFLTSPAKKWFRNTMIRTMTSPIIFNRMKKYYFGYAVNWDEKIK
ncbi:NAD(P)/FAD-dependent oxidoreductase [Nitrosopumilus sp.]|uniref:FAD-dependent oxidoreductase n=1 Tax=Nitrosopumilus sp. TaxID=2024843 RepID=UPI00293102EE|nr:NAD(P)/FAD-dependent oxidoreductase [Nitrosopumilus sp.]